MLSTDFSTTTSSDLVYRVARGEAAAFGELYDRYSARVLGMAVRLVRDHAIAEEVAQEVFLELWQKAATLRPTPGEIVGLLLSITRQRAIDRIRSEQAARDRTIRFGIRDLPVDRDVVAEAVELAGTRSDIGLVLDSLTPLQRETIELHFSGYSHREVAGMLGVPIGTVKTRMHDGMARLRAQLAA